ncbi:MAG: hypothetical protein JNL72_11995 [Flavipsychrobacter sp.]|nr:hypothetical protein [Flavipsychrobacter sp.]
MSDSKNNTAWEQLFAKHNIVENVLSKGHYIISSSDINKFREARLMTKFDHESQLPRLFSKNNLSILPISRGSYIISTFEAFKQFDSEEIPVTKIDFPYFLESLNYKEINSEATAINCAFVSGMLADFISDIDLNPTVSGRMSSQSFKFNINCSNTILNISVENSQIEIDGGYESTHALNLIEAKNYISKDFLIRQLYYPFRLWSSRITKKIRNIFLTYTNGIFHFREYKFTDVNHYNSLRLVNQKKYIFKEAL